MGISISGISSGLDTASMITQLMNVEKIPLTDLQNKQADLQNKQSIYRSINLKLQALQTSINNMNLASSWNPTSTTVGNSSILSATSDSTAAQGTYNITVSNIATAGSMSSEVNGGIGILPTADGSGLNGQTFTVNNGTASTTVTINGANTMGDVLSQISQGINSANVGLNASVINVDATHQKLVLFSKDTGTANDIELGAAADGTKRVLDISNSLSTALGMNNAAPGQLAIDAQFNINGIDVTQSTNTIKNAVTGVNLTLSSKGTTTVTVQQDATKIDSMISGFVSAYNDAVNLIRQNTAKGAPLQGDSTLNALSDTLFNTVTRMITLSDPTKKNALASIGLEIDKGVTTASSMTGNLAFDSTAFNAYFNSNPVDLKSMFMGNANDKGILNDLNSKIQGYTDFVTGALTSTIKGYDSQISDTQNNINDLTDRLNDKQDQLKKQFSDMEVALGNLKSQQSWLTSQLASLSAK